MRLLLLLMFISSVSFASKVIVNQSEFVISETATRIDCNSISVVGEETTECCIGQSCQNHSTILFNKPGASMCPRIVIDNYIYNLNGLIDIHHNMKMFIAQSNQLSGCLNGNNQPPTMGSGFLAVVNTETMGVENAFFDVNNWTLNITSIDGDIVCAGGTPYANVDIIFDNGFEGDGSPVNPDIVFSNGFE